MCCSSVKRLLRLFVDARDGGLKSVCSQGSVPPPQLDLLGNRPQVIDSTSLVGSGSSTQAAASLVVPPPGGPHAPRLPAACRFCCFREALAPAGGRLAARAWAVPEGELMHAAPDWGCVRARVGVALPLAATLQQLCLRASRRSRGSLAALACVLYFLALTHVGSPPGAPHPFWAPVSPALSEDPSGQCTLDWGAPMVRNPPVVLAMACACPIPALPPACPLVKVLPVHLWGAQWACCIHGVFASLSIAHQELWCKGSVLHAGLGVAFSAPLSRSASAPAASIAAGNYRPPPGFRYALFVLRMKGFSCS